MKIRSVELARLCIVWAWLLYWASAGSAYGQGAGSGSYLLVPDYDKHEVLRFDAATGAFVDEFVSRQSGGLNQPWIALVGPHDGNLYVCTGHFRGPGQIKAVLRYDGTTGAFLDEFVQRGQMDMAHAVMFGPDGNGDGHQDVYVSNITFTGFYGKNGNVKRYDGLTGAFIDTFVPTGSGGLDDPNLITFTETDPVTLEYLGD